MPMACSTSAGLSILAGLVVIPTSPSSSPLRDLGSDSGLGLGPLVMSSKWALWKISGPFLSPETSLSPQKVLQPVSSSSPSLSLAIGQCRRLSSKTMWWSSFVLFCPLVSCGCPLSSRLQSSTISTLCNAVPFILCSQVLPCPLVLQPQSGRCLPVHPQLARPFLCCCIVFLS